MIIKNLSIHTMEIIYIYLHKVSFIMTQDIKSNSIFSPSTIQYSNLPVHIPLLKIFAEILVYEWQVMTNIHSRIT